MRVHFRQTADTVGRCDQLQHSGASRGVSLVSALLLCALAWMPAWGQSSEVRSSADRTTKLSPTQDSDGDRVVDARDMCPGTPDGWSVKHNGCPVYQRVSTPGQLAGEGKIALNADIMFDTASAQISPRGQVIVARLATELKAAAPLAGYKRQIRLAGYTDLMGRWVQNLSLSQKRADAVRLLLIEEGVAPSSIRATGYASSDPVVQCPATGPRDARISCLAPNRRVEIEVKQIPAL